MRRFKVVKRLLEWLRKPSYSTVTEQIFKPRTYPNVSLCMLRFLKQRFRKTVFCGRKAT
jgi:hypothetical protein